jgi:hypothetical protein
MRRRLPAAQGALCFTPQPPPQLLSLPTQAGDRVAVWIRDCNPDDELLQAAVYNVAYAMKVRDLCAAQLLLHVLSASRVWRQQDVLVIPEQERVMFQSHAGVAAGARAPEAEV